MEIYKGAQPTSDSYLGTWSDNFDAGSEYTNWSLQLETKGMSEGVYSLLYLVTDRYDNVVSDVYFINIYLTKQSVGLNSIAFDGVGASLTLIVDQLVYTRLIFNPYNTTVNRSFTITSSNPNAVKVLEVGGEILIKAIGGGSSVVTANANGKTVSVNVVVSAPCTNIWLNQLTAEMHAGQTMQLTATTTPANTTSPLTWHTADPTIATVDTNGVVTALRGGTVRIYAECNGLAGICDITVTDHTKENVKRVEPTATRKGSEDFHCTICNQDIHQVLDQQFLDTNGDYWYADGIDYVYDNHLMKGMEERAFGPDDYMSRAMLVTVLWRQAGSPEPDAAADFIDVPDGLWFSDAVAWASENEIVNGVGDNQFTPFASITREQIATILWRYSEKPEGTGDLSDYPDADKVSVFAEDAMSWAVGANLIKGDADPDGNTRLDPWGSATRAQVATILMRYLEMD